MHRTVAVISVVAHAFLSPRRVRRTLAPETRRAADASRVATDEYDAVVIGAGAGAASDACRGGGGDATALARRHRRPVHVRAAGELRQARALARSARRRRRLRALVRAQRLHARQRAEFVGRLRVAVDVAAPAGHGRVRRRGGLGEAGRADQAGTLASPPRRGRVAAAARSRRRRGGATTRVDAAARSRSSWPRSRTRAGASTTSRRRNDGA